MTLLQAQGATKQFGSKILFDHAAFAINEGEHVGVIGPNGAGKTTLFKILAGQEELDSGVITKSRSLRLGYLEQEADWNFNEKVEEYLTQNCIKPIWELKQLGLKLGLSETHFQSFLTSLSGGYRMRVKLLYLIGMEPNLLLLDEPTNFLDLETLLVLEQFLQESNSAFLLISHDREFLRRVTDHILEVESGEITKFNGNIDDYFEQKAQLQTLLEKQALSQEAKRKSIQDFVNRFGAKATKARQAQSRLKALEKMETIDLKAPPARSVIQLPPASSTGKMILELNDGICGYGDRVVLRNINLRLERGHHLGIVGLNGAGKSTLLKSLAKEIPLLGGELKWGYQVELAYYAQHTPEKLNLEQTVLEALALGAHPSVLRQEILNMAGSLLFSGEAASKKIKVLSGGEKSRVAMGQVLLKKAPLLLLDEPTNHFDFDTVEALTAALEKYEGTIVTVSHDRGFIGRVANRILEVNQGQLTLYPGTYDEYVWSVQKGILALRNENSNPEPRSKSTVVSAKPPSSREEKKRLETRIRQLQKLNRDLEKKISDLNKKRDELTHQLISLKGDQAVLTSKELHLVSGEISALEEQMLNHMEEEMKASLELSQV